MHESKPVQKFYFTTNVIFATFAQLKKEEAKGRVDKAFYIGNDNYVIIPAISA